MVCKYSTLHWDIIFQIRWSSIRTFQQFRHAHFCTNDYPFSCCMGVRHAHFCTNDYPFLVVWVFVMHISVRMTIHIHMVFRHAHFCTNDYPYFFNGFSSCTFLNEWLPITLFMGSRHAHFCTNDYPFLCVRIFVIHISVQMTIHIILGFLSCTYLYEWLFVPNFFPMRFC